MAWFYEQAGAPVGPTEEAEFDRLVAAGTIQPGTLVWREGQSGWLPLAQVRPAAATSAAPAGLATPVPTPAEAPKFEYAPVGAAGPTARCQACQRTFPVDEVVMVAGALVCASCKADQLQRIRQGQRLAGTVWRSGRLVLVSVGSDLPERCVKCNASEDLFRLRRKLYWHHPAIYLALFFYVLLYAIIAVIVRKSATVQVSLCRQHRNRRRLLIGCAIGCLVAAVGVVFGLASWRVENLLWLLAPLLVIASIVLGVMSRVVYATKIDDKFVKLAGTDPRFRESLPQWVG